MTSKRTFAQLAFLGAALVLIACNGRTIVAPDFETNLDFGSLGGQIRVDGSSTVFPISEAVAEEFSYVSRTRVNVGFSGTGGGFEKFCRGETQVSNASRPIKDSELEACRKNGIDDVLEIQVAIDALTVLVNPENDWVQCLTVDETHQLFSAGGAERWNDVRPDWPDKKISRYYPGPDSGTFDYFNETIIEAVEGATHTAEGTPSEDDNILAIGVQEDRYAIGYFGFAYFLGSGASMKAVAIDNGNGCVEPSFETALNGSYAPLSRPLFIYTRESFMAERPEMLGFIEFYIKSMDVLVPDVGYITMPEADKLAQLAKIEPYLQAASVAD